MEVNFCGAKQQAIEQATAFQRLSNATCVGDIKNQLANTNEVAATLSNQWKSHGVLNGAIIRLLKTLVWSAATYSQESCVFKENEQRIMAVKMRGLQINQEN